MARDRHVVGGRRDDHFDVQTLLALAAADVEGEEVAREAPRGARVSHVVERQREQMSRSRVAVVRRQEVDLAARGVHRQRRRRLVLQRRRGHSLQRTAWRLSAH